MCNPTKYILFAFALLLFAYGAAPCQTNNCIDCHQAFEDENDGPSYKFARDVHGQKGISCYDCHGGDPSLEDMDDVRASKNYRGVPGHFEIPEFCARCHSNAQYMHEHNPRLPVDQLAKYKTSVHGQRFFGKHDKKVATCISCHTPHEIANAKLPYSSTYPQNIPKTCGKCHANKDYMAEYSIPTNQLEEYSKSVHGVELLEKNDLGAPACNDCHGNHGAAPPGITSLTAVCGMCHAIEEQLFTSSPHNAAFEEMDFAMCGACHNHHYIKKPTEQMLGSTDGAVCTNCHTADDGTSAFMTADSLRVSIRGLKDKRDTAHTMLEEADRRGMMVTDASFLLKDVDQAIVKARTMVHAFNIDSLTPIAEDGLEKADSVEVISAKLIDEYYFRRKGLGISTLIITFLVVILYLRIRGFSRAREHRDSGK
jgi:predicted CXXCH cytochrome family protein